LRNIARYGYITDSGSYRLPASEEEKRLKEEARANGTNRLIKRFVTYIEQGIVVPERLRHNDITIAELIRHCKRFSMFDHGRILYEKGGLNLDNLPEEVMVNVEEDYQVCILIIERGKK